MIPKDFILLDCGSRLMDMGTEDTGLVMRARGSEFDSQNPHGRGREKLSYDFCIYRMPRKYTQRWGKGGRGREKEIHVHK